MPCSPGPPPGSFSVTCHVSLSHCRFGDSVGGELICALLAWPTPWVILCHVSCVSLAVGLETVLGES